MSQNHDPTACRTPAQILAQCRIADDFTREWSKLLKALDKHAQDNGEKAAGAITLTIKPSLKNGQLEINSSVATKLPTPASVRSFAFLDHENVMTKRDPDQPDLPIIDVSAPAPSMIDAD